MKPCLRMWCGWCAVSGRTFIITRFTPTAGGHGHHLSSAILAREAFTAAADPGRFPETVEVREALAGHPHRVEQFPPPIRSGGPLPASALSWISAPTTAPRDVLRRAGGRGPKHAPQPGIRRRGATRIQLQYFEITWQPARLDLFEDVDLSWGACPVATKWRAVGPARRSFLPEQPAKALPMTAQGPGGHGPPAT